MNTSFDTSTFPAGPRSLVPLYEGTPQSRAITGWAHEFASRCGGRWVADHSALPRGERYDVVRGGDVLASVWVLPNQRAPFSSVVTALLQASRAIGASLVPGRDGSGGDGVLGYLSLAGTCDLVAKISSAVPPSSLWQPPVPVGYLWCELVWEGDSITIAHRAWFDRGDGWRALGVFEVDSEKLTMTLDLPADDEILSSPPGGVTLALLGEYSLELPGDRPLHVVVPSRLVGVDPAGDLLEIGIEQMTKKVSLIGNFSPQVTNTL